MTSSGLCWSGWWNSITMQNLSIPKHSICWSFNTTVTLGGFPIFAWNYESCSDPISIQFQTEKEEDAKKNTHMSRKDDGLILIVIFFNLNYQYRILNCKTYGPPSQPGSLEGPFCFHKQSVSWFTSRFHCLWTVKYLDWSNQNKLQSDHWRISYQAFVTAGHASWYTCTAVWIWQQAVFMLPIRVLN